MCSLMYEERRPLSVGAELGSKENSPTVKVDLTL